MHTPSDVLKSPFSPDNILDKWMNTNGSDTHFVYFLEENYPYTVKHCVALELLSPHHYPWCV